MTSSPEPSSAEPSSAQRSSPEPAPPVLVGVDLSAGSEELAVWAARAAASRHRDLVLVHVAAPGPGPRSGLDDLLAAVRRAVPAVSTRWQIAGGPADSALVAASRAGCLLVLGTHGRADFTRSALGSLGYRVAIRSDCPVVIVPPATPYAQAPRVVVGVAGGPAAQRAVRFAAHEAARSGATLILARSTASGTDGPDELAAQLVATHPGLAVDAVRGSGNSTGSDGAAELLLQHAGPGALIVVGCHHTDERFTARLGDVPTAVLARTACPVVLVGHGDGTQKKE